MSEVVISYRLPQMREMPGALARDLQAVVDSDMAPTEDPELIRAQLGARAKVGLFAVFDLRQIALQERGSEPGDEYFYKANQNLGVHADNFPNGDIILGSVGAADDVGFVAMDLVLSEGSAAHASAEEGMHQIVDDFSSQNDSSLAHHTFALMNEQHGIDWPMRMGEGTLRADETPEGVVINNLEYIAKPKDTYGFGPATRTLHLPLPYTEGTDGRRAFLRSFGPTLGTDPIGFVEHVVRSGAKRVRGSK